MTEDRAISLNAVLNEVVRFSTNEGGNSVCTDLYSHINELPSVTPSEDAISRDAVIKLAYDMSEIDGEHFGEPCMVVDVEDIQKLLPVMSQPKHEIDHEYCKDCLHVEMCKWYGYTGCEFRDTYEDIAKKQDRPNGHWIEHKNDGECTYYECSECGEELFCDKSNFCPNCGSYNGGDDNADSD